MKKVFLIAIISCCLSIMSCKDDEVVTCVTCTSPDAPLSFELCKEGDGNASINGESTGIPYETYLGDLEETGVNCGI